MNKLIIFILTSLATSVVGQVNKKQNPGDFLPNGYVIFETITGDLNNDDIEDCILIIKGTDKNQIITDEYRGELDRNRRGIIVLFNKNGHYELALSNYNCFSSENEDGGVYFAPELSIEIRDRNLSVHYGHGRYGYWIYTFKFQNLDFELIGYDAGFRSNFESDWVIFDQKSINFLSKKKLMKEVIKVSADGKEMFKETSKNITIEELIKLSEINDFDQLDMTLY